MRTFCVLCKCRATTSRYGFSVCAYHNTHGEDDLPCPTCTPRPNMLPCGACRTPRDRCMICGGDGWVPRPDPADILPRILNLRGDLTSSPPSVRPRQYRSYIIWRWVRFHLGIDTSIPTQAIALIVGDPWEDDLMEFAVKVGRMLHHAAG